MVDPVNMLYLGAGESTDIVQRPQQLARRLAQFYRLVYVEPVGLRSIRLSDFWRLGLRLKSVFHRKNAARAMGFETVSFLYLPLSAPKMLSNVNERMLLFQARRRFPFLKSRDYVLWIGSPNHLARALLRENRPLVSVYDCMDDLGAIHKDDGANRIVEAEQEVVDSVDIVFASSERLHERMARRNPNTHLIQNAVDLAWFNQTSESDSFPTPLFPSDRPVVGYYGTLGHWVDFELIDYVARLQSDWSIVLIGPAKVPKGAIPQRKNVFWIGPQPHERLAQYARKFNAAMLPFLVNDLTASVDPVKLYEYLALGKSVVSTDLPEVRKFRSLVRIAKDHDDFLTCLKEEVARPYGPTMARRRFEFVQEHSWDRRVEEIMRVLDSSKKRTENQECRTSGRKGLSSP